MIGTPFKPEFFDQASDGSDDIVSHQGEINRYLINRKFYLHLKIFEEFEKNRNLRNFEKFFVDQLKRGGFFLGKF